ESLFRDSDRTFDAFARDYMALQTKASRQSRASEIYHEFRTFFAASEAADGLESSLEQLLRFARYHAAFSLGRGGPDKLKTALARLNKLAEVAAILVMRLSDCHDHHGTLTEAE